MKQPSKVENCLYAFLEAGTAGLRQIEVASPLKGYTFKCQAGLFWSSCLNTDVSKLGKRGIHINRKPDPYIRRSGDKAHFNRYWIANRSTALYALKLVNQYRTRRGADMLPVSLGLSLVDQFPEGVSNQALCRNSCSTG